MRAMAAARSPSRFDVSRANILRSFSRIAGASAFMTAPRPVVASPRRAARSGCHAAVVLVLVQVPLRAQLLRGVAASCPS